MQVFETLISYSITNGDIYFFFFVFLVLYVSTVKTIFHERQKNINSLINIQQLMFEKIFTIKL